MKILKIKIGLNIDINIILKAKRNYIYGGNVFK